MSYDIRIIKSDDPNGEPTDVLDVPVVIGALNSFPPFLKRGITWSNQRWNEHAAWEGLVIYLEGHDLDKNASGQWDENTGTCDSVLMCISYRTESNIRSCLELAIRIGEETGATTWDLQTDRQFTPSDGCTPK
jgi:hypothetical protein